MQIGNTEASTLFRLEWEQDSGRSRSRWYTRRDGAERKAEKMRADGKACEITEWVAVRTGGVGGSPEPRGAAARPETLNDHDAEALLERVYFGLMADDADEAKLRRSVTSPGNYSVEEYEWALELVGAGWRT